jgi:hypothetical protein
VVVKDFSLLPRNKVGSGAHSACYPMCARGCIPVGKATALKTDNSPSSSGKVKNGEAKTSLPLAFMAFSA